MPQEKLINERIADLYPGMGLWKIHIDLCREQDKNARVMDAGRFFRLTENIKTDARLESLPLVIKDKNPAGNTEFHIISGHHRIRAARAADIFIIFVMVIEDMDLAEQIGRDMVKSKQLSHNELNGIDDDGVRKEIYNEILCIDAKVATGLIDYEMDLEGLPDSLNDVTFDMDYEAVTVLFLTEQKKDFEKAIRAIEQKGDVVVENLKSFTGFKKAMRAIGRNEDIRNVSCMLARMSAIVIEYYEKRKTTNESNG